MITSFLSFLSITFLLFWYQVNILRVNILRITASKWKRVVYIERRIEREEKMLRKLEKGVKVFEKLEKLVESTTLEDS